mgnify:CR=1 FL=1
MNTLILMAVLISIFSLSGCQPKMGPEKNAVESAEFFKDMENAPVEVAQGESQPRGEAVSATEETAATMAPEKPTAQDIQVALKNAQLYQGKVDGILGPRTRRAIEDFQQQNDLKVDGKVGPQTWAKLKAYFGQLASEGSVTDHPASQQTDRSSGIKD